MTQRSSQLVLGWRQEQQEVVEEVVVVVVEPQKLQTLGQVEVVAKTLDLVVAGAESGPCHQN